MLMNDWFFRACSAVKDHVKITECKAELPVATSYQCYRYDVNVSQVRIKSEMLSCVMILQTIMPLSGEL